MPNYSRYKTKTLERMRAEAWKKYCAETTKHYGGWGDGVRLAKLPQLKAWEKAKERYEAICTEIEKRQKK